MKKYLLSFALVLVLSGAAFVGVPKAKGALLYYHNNSQIGKSATSSSAYIIGGNGTTTQTFQSDGYQNASYMIELASSTTPPTVCWRNQYSNDGTFWYSQGDITDVSTSTTATVFVPSTPKETCWTYASTTAPATSQNAQLTAGADGKEVYVFRKISTPVLDTLYTRTVFYINAGVNARLGVERNLKNEVTTSK